MAWLMVKVGAKDRGHQIDEDVVFVGSAEDAHVRVGGDGVAPRHCQVLRIGDRYRLIDLGAASGTSVNGAAVRDHVLSDGDVIQVGVATMTFRSKAATGAAAPGAVQQRPGAGAPIVTRSARPGAGAAVVRRSKTTGRASSSRDDEDDDERRPRHARKQSIPVPVIVITLMSLCGVAGYMIYKVMSGKPQIYLLIQQAEEYERLNNYDAALAKIYQAQKLLNPSARSYKTDKLAVENRINSYKSHKGVKEVLHIQKDESIWYNTVIVPFHESYIDETHPKFQGKQYIGDPATARYFAEFRLKPFLEKFPDSKNVGQVKAWLETMKTRYNEAGPFPSPTDWWDTEVIQYHEYNWEHYGFAYQTIRKFQTHNPTYKPKSVNDRMAEVVEAATGYWNARKTDIAGALTAKNYQMALARAIRAVELLKGIDELAQQAYDEAQRIKQVASGNGVSLATEIPSPR